VSLNAVRRLVRMSDMTNGADDVGKPDRDSRNIAYTGGDTVSEYQTLAL
jgi:hypothetical protein